MDVADVVFLTLADLQPDADVFRVDVPYAVAEDGGITIAQLVVFLNELLLVGLPALGRELLGL